MREKANYTQTKYDVAKEFSAGFCAAILPEAVDHSKSTHWHAGYAAGYSFRQNKNHALNEYLVELGYQPMAKIRLAEQERSGT